MSCSPSMLRAALPVVLALLAGCGHLSVAALPRLSRVDPATTDFAAVRVALATPRALRPGDGGVRLVLKRRIAGADDSAAFVLNEIPVSPDLAAPRGTASDDGELRAYALAPDDARRLAALRDEMVRARAAGLSATATFAVIAEGYCRAGARLPDRLPISTYLRTAETGDFVPLVVDFDLAGQPGMAEALRARPPCTGAAKPA